MGIAQEIGGFRGVVDCVEASDGFFHAVGEGDFASSGSPRASSPSKRDDSAGSFRCCFDHEELAGLASSDSSRFRPRVSLVLLPGRDGAPGRPPRGRGASTWKRSTTLVAFGV